MIARKAAICGLLVIMLSAAPLSGFSAAAKETVPGKLFSVKEAIAAGLKRDADLKGARTNLSKKKTEWKQAQVAVIHQAQKDAGLFAKPHSLSKDLEIRMKLPEAKKALVEAQETVTRSEMTAADKIRKLYIAAVAAEYGESESSNAVQRATNELKDTKVKAKLNKAVKTDIEEAEKALDEASSAYKQAQLAYKNARIALGKATGLDLEKGYRFELQAEYAVLDTKAIWNVIDYARKRDLGLTIATMNRQLAEEKVRVTRQLYTAKFGASDMKIIESMYKKKDNEMDEELFNAVYETFLERVEKQWEGFITILIPLPKSLFQGEFDGIRYFDDIRYSLPVSMFELEKAQAAEQDTLEQLLAGVKQSFLDAKSAEEAYAQSLRTVDAAKQEVAKAKAKLKLRQIDQAQFKEKEDALAEAEKQQKQAFLAYYSSIYQLDHTASGAIAPVIRPGILPWKQIDDGLSPINQAPAAAKPLQGGWKIESVVDPLVQSMTLQTDPQLGASHYQLVTAEDKPLSKVLPIKEPFIHMNFVFQNPEEFKILFYRDEKPVAVGSLSGIGGEGAMSYSVDMEDVKPVESAKPDSGAGGASLIIGTYQLDMDSLSKETVNAAIATMSESGQGILFKSELTGGNWIDVNKTPDLAAALEAGSGKGAAAVNSETVAAFDIKVTVSSNGAITSTQTSAELQADIEALKAKKAQVEKQRDEASAAAEPLEAANLDLEAGIAAAQIEFLEALLEGKPDEAAQKLKAWHAAASGEDMAASSNEAAALSESLNKEAEERETAYEQALSTSDDGVIVQAAIQLAEIQADIAALEAGLAESKLAIEQALNKLQSALSTAEEEGDLERAQSIADSINVLTADLAQEQKRIDFIDLSILQSTIADLSERDIDAEPLIERQLDTVQAIVQAEELKYNEEELAALDAEMEQIAQLFGDELSPLPAQNVISAEFDIKLDLPPVLADGHALIQIRPISESFGALVVWDPEDQSVTITKDGVSAICLVGDSIGYVDGQPVKLDTAPRLLLDRVVVPLDFVADALGIDASWNERTQTIQLANQGESSQ